MHTHRTAKGELTFRDIPRICVDLLRTLPELLASDDPAVCDRLLPRAYEDDELEQEWRRVGAPELEHLFASRTRLIARDLASLSRERDGTWSLTMDSRHENAWLSGLNAARHILYILYGLDPRDMERDPEELEDPDQAMALFRIQLLAWMQELMLQSDAPPPEPRGED